jgi:hypothetical protein
LRTFFNHYQAGYSGKFVKFREEQKNRDGEDCEDFFRKQDRSFAIADKGAVDF